MRKKPLKNHRTGRVESIHHRVIIVLCYLYGSYGVVVCCGLFRLFLVLKMISKPQLGKSRIFDLLHKGTVCVCVGLTGLGAVSLTILCYRFLEKSRAMVQSNAGRLLAEGDNENLQKI